MKAAKSLGLLAELTLLAIGVATGGPINAQVRAIALVVGVVIAGAVAFVVVCFVIGLLQQRQPPYEI